MIISVVMATYNGGAYLGEQLASLVAQSRLPDELIISDDNSTDTTLKILDEFRSRSPFPVTIHRNRERGGYSVNFSEAALMARGDLILFCDQDDYWEPNKIHLVAQWFDANPDKSLAIHDIAICDENLEVVIRSYFKHLEKCSSAHRFIKGCATAARRSLVDAAFPLPPLLGWTHDSRIHAIARIRECEGRIGEVLVKHRMHASQTSGYVVQDTSLSKRVQIFINRRIAASEPAWFQSLFMLPDHLTSELLEELFLACGYKDIEPSLADTFARLERRNSLMTGAEATGKAGKLSELTRFFFAGGYKGLGGTRRYLWDAVGIVAT